MFREGACVVPQLRATQREGTAFQAENSRRKAPGVEGVGPSREAPGMGQDERVGEGRAVAGTGWQGWTLQPGGLQGKVDCPMCPGKPPWGLCLLQDVSLQQQSCLNPGGLSPWPQSPVGMKATEAGPDQSRAETFRLCTLADLGLCQLLQPWGRGQPGSPASVAL